ncbi:cation transporter [Herbiconiux sp. YIM B11900]|uniref:heavy-metal-associated domain-containing protein n=1 Tax=Herbiconiux sp. YIM B11900 TaxID=3404131 RepID=UPI003F85E311
MNDLTHPDLGLTARDGSACGCASHAEPGASDTHPTPAASEAHPAPAASEAHPAPAASEAHPAPAASEAHPAPAASEAHPAPAVDGVAADAGIEYRVTGMTCAHCVASVTEEISAIDGIDTVQVRLNVGGESLVSVRGAAAADRAAVAAAVDEAGYALAGE